MKTIAEQIAALEEARAKKAKRMNEVMEKSVTENRSTDAAEQEEFDTLQREVDAIDADLKRFKALEAVQAKTAKPITAPATEAAASQLRATPTIMIKTQPKVDKGVRFARLARCIALAKLNSVSAREVAGELYKDDDQIASILKANVVAGSTVSGTWGADLVGSETSLFADFVEFLRPMTILGKFGAGGIPGLRQVPFRVPLISQAAGGSGYWVGEGKPKPVTAFDFNRTTLSPLKVANIAVATMELLRDSSPSAEVLLRDQLAAALRERMDIDFIDPAKAASAGVSPASITNGLTPIASTGNDADAVREDIRAIMAAFVEADNPPTTGVWVMASVTALAVSLMVNALGQREFPNITMNGGILEGLPVITSEYVPFTTDGHYVMLVNAGDIWFADDGEVSVDMSMEASLQMLDNPTNDVVTPTATSLVSLWQNNSVGFRAERTVNWARRRTSGVQVLSAVNWGQPGS